MQGLIPAKKSIITGVVGAEIILAFVSNRE
jgi:hypothetical protein